MRVENFAKIHFSLCIYKGNSKYAEADCDEIAVIAQDDVYITYKSMNCGLRFLQAYN